MGDSESRRNARALKEAFAKVKRHPQNKFVDLPRFVLDISKPIDEFRKVIGKRDAYYKEIASCLVEGVPVTVPMTDTNKDAHHVVELLNSKARDDGDDPNDIVAVQLLFRNYDNYYTAFRPIKRSHQERDPSGWFHFDDVSVPEFLQKDLRKRKKVYGLPISCAYRGLNVTKVGHDSLLSMFKCYARFTPTNFQTHDDVEKVAQTTMIFFGEGQRFPEIVDELTRRMASGIVEVLPTDLNRYINQWKSFSVRAFKHARGVAGALQLLEELYGFTLHVGNEYQLSLFVGPKISLLKYDDFHTLELIKQRRR